MRGARRGAETPRRVTCYANAPSPDLLDPPGRFVTGGRGRERVREEREGGRSRSKGKGRGRRRGRDRDRDRDKEKRKGRGRKKVIERGWDREIKGKRQKEEKGKKQTGKHIDTDKHNKHNERKRKGQRKEGRGSRTLHSPLPFTPPSPFPPLPHRRCCPSLPPRTNRRTHRPRRARLPSLVHRGRARPYERGSLMYCFFPGRKFG